MKRSQEDQRLPSDLPPLGRHLCNLHHAEPIIRLNLRRKNLCAAEPGLFDGIDMLYSAMALIVFLMEKRATDLGAEREEILEFMAQVIGAMRPTMRIESLRLAGEIILDELMNRSGDYEAFQQSYFEPGSGMLRHDFKLIELDTLDGRNLYQATKQAVVLHLAMLDVDPALAQRAEEMILKYLVDMGRFQESIRLAHQARSRSIQFQQLIQSKIFEALRAPESIPWVRTVVPELTAAAAHVGERRQQEKTILDALNAHREHASPENRGVLFELQRLVEDCQHRHSSLHSEILTANEKFLAAQTRVFRTRRAQPQHDLEQETLLLMLSIPVGVVSTHADGIAALLSPPRVPELLDLASTWCQLAQPPPKTASTSAVVEDFVELEQSRDPFPQALIASVRDYLTALLEANPVIDIESILNRAHADGLDRLQRRCAAFLLLEAYHPDVNPFRGVVKIASPQSRFETEIALGSRLVFTHGE